MKANGIVYTSFKYGDFEGERNGRYFTDFTPEAFGEFMQEVPELKIEEYWITGDVRPGRGEESKLKKKVYFQDAWIEMIQDQTVAEFTNILQKNMQPVYDSARRQGYEVWNRG